MIFVLYWSLLIDKNHFGFVHYRFIKTLTFADAYFGPRTALLITLPRLHCNHSNPALTMRIQVKDQGRTTRTHAQRRLTHHDGKVAILLDLVPPAVDETTVLFPRDKGLRRGVGSTRQKEGFALGLAQVGPGTLVDEGGLPEHIYVGVDKVIPKGVGGVALDDGDIVHGQIAEDH